MKPDLKFKISKIQDIENAKGFVKNNEYVLWFLPKELQFIIGQGLSVTKKNRIISEYTNNYYKIHKLEISKGVDEIKKRWAKIEDKYYDLVQKIFLGYDWPKGKYLGYASIYLMFPRYIKEKIFFFPYSFKGKWNPLRTIGHEMLHFIFFDYIKKKYKIKEGTRVNGENPKYVWQVSETFNTVIENWKPYRNIFGAKDIRNPYPGCEKMFKKMSRQWADNQNIKKLLDKWLFKFY